VGWWSGGWLLYQHHISLPVGNTSFPLLIKLAGRSVPSLATNGLEELQYRKAFPLDTRDSGLPEATDLLVLVLVAVLTAATGFLPLTSSASVTLKRICLRNRDLL